VTLTDHQLGRLAGALWARIGQRTTYHDLVWADDLMGPGGRDALWAELHAASALKEGELQPRPLASYLAHCGAALDTQLLWTLPQGLEGQGLSYVEGLTQTIQRAQRELLLMSPFIAAGGVHIMERDLRDALHRGVRVTLIGHDLKDLRSAQSQAIETLRQEAERMGAAFSAYAANHQSGLLHAKLAVADRERVVLGSANMTGHGLGINFEVGVVLGEPHAGHVAQTYDQLLNSALVSHVFTTLA
jgi:phosphatidylserine/phosphatidylglycerophosphate/cardiolipin synthase-like enzyme